MFVYAREGESFDGDPIALIVSANLSRRHLNKSQRAIALARVEGAVTQLPVRTAARKLRRARARGAV